MYDQHIRTFISVAYQDSTLANYVNATLDSTLLNPFEYFKSHNGKILLLELDGNIIGMLAMACYSAVDTEIMYLAIHPSHRRKGHGSFLLNQVMNSHTDLIINCYVTNPSAIAFCKSQNKLELLETYPKIVFGKVVPVMRFKNVLGCIVAKSRKRSWTPAFNKTTDRCGLLDQTDTNRTITNRTLTDYSSTFDINIQEELQTLYSANNKPLVILDSGCGKAVAMQQLLEDTKLSAYIAAVYAISKDYFREIESVISRHPNKFKYLPLTLDAALQTTLLKADLIFDLWGVFAYSFEKIKVLEQYYNTLAPGGRAYIFMGPVFHINGSRSIGPLIKILSDQEPQSAKFELLFEALIKRFPGQFRSTNFNSILIITRTSAEFPLKGDFTYAFSEYGTTFTQIQCIREAERGNATNYCDLRIICKMA